MSGSNLKPLILHAHATGPNPYKVAIALESLQIPYNVKLWVFGDGLHGVKGPAFLKNITPNGRVPVLEDPNTSVTSWESGACLAYLMRVYDNSNKLGPRENDEQARVDVDKWVFFLTSTLGPMMGQLSWFRHYNEQPNDDALRRYEQESHRCLQVLEDQLQRGDGKWILEGPGPSVVDLHFYPWVYVHKFPQLSLDNYPEIRQWMDNMAGLEEVKKAFTKIPEGEKA